MNLTWKRLALVGFLPLYLLFSTATEAAENKAIQKTRVALFYQEGFPGGSGPMPVLWYQETLASLGLKVKLISADELADSNYLKNERFDTILLPYGSYIPTEASYTLCQFLAEGGSIITTSLPVWACNYNQEKKLWEKSWELAPWTGASDLQVRVSYRKRAQSLNAAPKLNPDIPSDLLPALPPIAGPFPEGLGQPDKINLNQPSDFGSSGGENVETAANIVFPVYLLPTGEPTDFFVYRYHSAYFNNATLIHLGQVGASLLKGPAGKEVLYTVLKLCEQRLPGEESPVYYQRVLQLQQAVSDFGKAATETSDFLRDLAFSRFYQKEMQGFERLKEEFLSCEEGLSRITADKQQIDPLLVAGKDLPGQDVLRKLLLLRIKKESENLKGLREKYSKEKLGYPKEVKIENPLGKFVVAAGISWPIGLYTLRKNFFQTIKELGGDTYYSSWMNKDLSYLKDDPAVKKAREGVRFDFLFSDSNPTFTIVPSQGFLDLTTGEVKETPRQVYDYKAEEEKIKKFVEFWQGEPVLRFWSASERGLDMHFWGQQAREEYQAYLKEKYQKIEELNRRWQTGYKDFTEIVLLTSSPATIQQHGNWEDWTKFRAERFSSAIRFGYEAFKKYAPEIPFSYTVSAWSLTNPAYGINFYQLTKYQDINGMDAAFGVPPNGEWLWFDLTADKPHYTVEWGPFYVPPADIREGRKMLSAEAWTIVSGGSVGLNLWIWRWHGFRGNFVDTTGIPTLYGWQLKSMVSEFNRFDHIVLDGKRSKPAVRILFSDTTRNHQLGWGAWGVTSFSAHIPSTTNLYGFFLKEKEMARVLAEEEILEGNDFSSCRLLILPQADYLSEDLQKRLLDYVKKGGNLLLEGKAGWYDNYGRSSGLFFKEAGVIPAASVKEKSVLLEGGRAVSLSFPEFAFSPGLIFPEKGKALLNYSSGEPALVSVPCGSGKILVSGLPFSLVNNEDLYSLILKKVREEIFLPPQYLCSDRDLILREWEYRGEKYLICAYPQGKGLPEIKDFPLKVKGNWEVIDYLIGEKIPTSFDNNYTSFTGLVTSPGGRVYRLKPSSAGKTVSANPATFSNKSRKDDDTASLSLPFQGNLVVEQPREIDGFLFQSAVIPGQQYSSGEAYLTVSKGEKRLRRKMEAGKESLFFFPEGAFSVKCVDIQTVFPLWIGVEIKKVENSAVSSSCSLSEEKESLFLANGLVGLRVFPMEGANIRDFLTLPEGVNHLVPLGKYSTQGITVNEGNYAGSFYNKPFSYQVRKNTREEIVVDLKMNSPNNNLLLEKSLSLQKDQPKVGLTLKEYNCDTKPTALSLRLHPDMQVGGTADGADTFFVPTPEGLKTFTYWGETEGSFYFTPAAGWAACVDIDAKVAFLASFPLQEVEMVYVFMGRGQYNLELWTPKKEVKPNEYLSLHTDLYLFQGISGVDTFQNGLAAYLSLPVSSFSQDEEAIRGRVEAAGFLPEKGLKGRVSLLHEGKVLKEAVFEGEVSADKSLSEEFSLSAKGLADGTYSLLLSFNGTAPLRVKKEISLCGQLIKEGEKICSAYRKELEALKEKFSPEQLFAAFGVLEELHSAFRKADQAGIKSKKAELDRLLNKTTNIQ